MKTFISVIITLIALVFCIAYTSYLYGRNEVKLETVTRAKKVLEKDSYTVQDIEYIIFEQYQL